MLRQPGFRELALLVPQIALGDQEQRISPGEPRHDLGHPVEQFHGMREHRLGTGDDLADFRRANVPVGQLNRGFNAGEGVRLDAVTVELEVAHLGGEKPAVDRCGVVPAAQQRAVFFVGGRKDRLVVPERVVRIEANGRDHRVNTRPPPIPETRSNRWRLKRGEFVPAAGDL